MTLAQPTETAAVETLDTEGFLSRFARVKANLGEAVVASEQTLELALLGLFAEGHVLIEDRPGVGKTLLAKSLAQSIQGSFARVQFTPDLLPSDITGSSIFNPGAGTFEFMPGPIFANVLLADELNRTSPRTQSALLEAMAEAQVTADGITRQLRRPFFVIATQNSLDSAGTFPLPETELDRFLVKMSIGLPSSENELAILERSEHGPADVKPVLTTDEVIAMQDYVRRVEAARPVKEYMVEIARAVREHPSVQRGMSPRGTVSLQRAAQCRAAFLSRTFVAPEDVQAVAPLVIPHRLTVEGHDRDMAEQYVRELLEQVPVPF